MLPKPINPAAVLGQKKNAQDYETQKHLIDAHNQLVGSLGPGAALTGSNFTTSAGLSIQVGSISGTVKRGKFTVAVGAQVNPNSTVTITFPSGTFVSPPYANIIRNGGTGQSIYSYTETAQSITLSIASPVNGESYGFQYQLSE